MIAFQGLFLLISGLAEAAEISPTAGLLSLGSVWVAWGEYSTDGATNMPTSTEEFSGFQQTSDKYDGTEEPNTITESETGTFTTTLTLASSAHYRSTYPSTSCGLHQPTSLPFSETPPLGTSVGAVPAGTAPAGTGTGEPAILTNGTVHWSVPSLHSNSYDGFVSEAAAAPTGKLFWAILLITLAHRMWS